ncbi:MAG: ATP synthase F1 subunit gamma [Clostridia bacterium]|nr:ATP synthase F1 subunit gamma [Clostridia bacterium]
MPGMRDITRRIKSVKNIQQITKAMKMMSAAQLRKAQERVIAARPLAQEPSEVLSRLVGVASDLSHPLLAKREPKNIGYVVITADRGFCGGYNANILRKSAGEIKQLENVSLITVGRKSRDFFRRSGKNIVAEFTGLGEDIQFGVAKKIAQKVMDYYIAEEFDEVYLVYTEFVSALTQNPTTIKLLPVEPPAEEGASVDYIYEPSAESILSVLLPKYVETTVFRALLESKASELGARMTAMGSATDNAKELIAKLTLSYNRARQAAITREISEIVGGAAALE